MLSLKRRAGVHMVVDATRAMVAPSEMFACIWNDHRGALASRVLEWHNRRWRRPRRPYEVGRGQVSDADPPKQLIKRELANRDDIDGPKGIWGISGRSIHVSPHSKALAPLADFRVVWDSTHPSGASMFVLSPKPETRNPKWGGS